MSNLQKRFEVSNIDNNVAEVKQLKIDTDNNVGEAIKNGGHIKIILSKSTSDKKLFYDNQINNLSSKENQQFLQT